MRTHAFKKYCLVLGALLFGSVVQAGGIEGTYDNGYLGDPDSCPSLNVSDPVNVMTGNLFHKEPVYKDTGDFPLEFNWYYNSRSKEVDPATGQVKYTGQWTYSYGQYAYLKITRDAQNRPLSYLVVVSEDGSEIEYGPDIYEFNKEQALSDYPDIVGTTSIISEYGLTIEGGLSQPTSSRTMVKGNEDRLVKIERAATCKGQHVCSITGFRSITRRRASDGVLEVFEFIDRPNGRIVKFVPSGSSSVTTEQAPNLTTGLLSKLIHPTGQTQTIRRSIGFDGYIEDLTVSHSNGRTLTLAEGGYRNYILNPNKAIAKFNVLKVGSTRWRFRSNTRIYGPREILQLKNDDSVAIGVQFDYGLPFFQKPGGGLSASEADASWLSDTGMNSRSVKGQTVAGWRYDTKGRAVFAFHGPDSQAPERPEQYQYMTLADRFDDPFAQTEGDREGFDHHDKRSVTNMLTNRKTTYQFERVTLGKVPRSLLTGITGAETTNCGKAGAVYGYNRENSVSVVFGENGVDLPGKLQQIKDAKGFITSFKYHYLQASKTGRLQSKTIAKGAANERKIEYDWKIDAPHLLTKLDTPELQTEFIYTTNNRIEDIIQTDKTNHTVPYSTSGKQRKWHFDYTYHDTDQLRLKTKVLTIPSGRTTVTESYDESGHLVEVEKKNLETNQTFVTKYSQFNDWGLPASIINEQNQEIRVDYYRGVNNLFVSSLSRNNSDGSQAGIFIDYHPALEVPSKITYTGGRSLSIHYVGEGTVAGPNADVDFIENDLGEKIQIRTMRPGYRRDGEFVAANETLKTVVQKYITADGSVAFQTKQIFDALDRLYKEVRGTQAGAKTEVEANYDLNDNLQFFKQNGLDANGSPLIIGSEFGFDALDQLASIKSPDAGTTAINDKQSTGSVTDAKDRVTKYVYNGFGEPILIDSPDAGKTAYWYNEGGQLEKVATGYDGSDEQVKNYEYDGFGRLSTVSYEGDAFAYKNEHYSYDIDRELVNGALGAQSPLNNNRLTSVEKGSETGKDNQYSIYHYTYDEAGNVKRESAKLGRNSGVRTTLYDYDGWDNNLVGLTYPSGLKLLPDYDSQDRVNKLEIKTLDGTVKKVVDDVVYYPFGPVKSIQFSNGLAETRTHNDGYQIDKIEVGTGSFLMDYAYVKGFGNIDSIRYQAANDEETFVYDKAHRLKSAKRNIYGSQSFDWSLIGDRDSQTLSNGVTQKIEYSNDPKGNSIAIPAQSRKYVFDLRGNLLDDLPLVASVSSSSSSSNSGSTGSSSGSAGKKNALYGYGPDNELLGVVNAVDKKIEVYCYNFKLERTCKERYPDANRTNYYYNQAGQLLSENTGSNWRDYVYINDLLVAVVDSISYSPTDTSVYYVHNNHLPAPVGMTNANKSVVWQAKYDPFGRASIPTSAVVNNFRLPGQYYDDITGLHYNHFRHYNPVLGRYMQSDPIGLAAGVNSYVYALNNPLNVSDVHGLDGISISLGIQSPAIRLADEFFGAGVGVSGLEAGLSFTFPGLWNPEAKFDVGGFVTVNGGVGWGFGRLTADLGYSDAGSLCDYAGANLDVDGVLGPVHMSLEGDGVDSTPNQISLGFAFAPSNWLRNIMSPLKSRTINEFIELNMKSSLSVGANSSASKSFMTGKTFDFNTGTGN